MSTMRGRGFEPTGPQQELIHKLRNGQTYGQLASERYNRSAVGLIGGGLNFLGGMVNAANSDKDRENVAKRDTMAAAIANAKKESSAQDEIRESSEQYGGPEYRRPAGAEAGDRPIPAWLSETQDLPAAADAAIAKQRANVSAAGSAVGGYHTPSGLEDASFNVGSQARDMQTGKNIMGMGGMMNSLPRVQR